MTIIIILLRLIKYEELINLSFEMNAVLETSCIILSIISDEIHELYEL